MQRVIPILFGASFTVALSVAAGLLLLRRSKLAFDRLEAWVFAFLSGSALVSCLVFLLSVVHQARAGVFLAAGAVLIGGAAFAGRAENRKARLEIKRLYLLLLTAFFVMYLFIALAPEVSPDGSGYHLGNVARNWRNHGFDWEYRSIYAAMPQGLEMLFLVAYTFGGMPAAAMVHLSFLCALALLLVCFGRRFQCGAAGWFAAVLVFASPVVGLVAASAYNDVALATCIYAVFYLTEVFREQSDRNILVLIGLLSGFAFAVKDTGGLVLPFTLMALRGRGARWIVAAAALIAAPWLLRDWWWLGNPFAPFLNRWFPNPLYSADLEAAYLHDLRHIEGFAHWWQIPLDMTIYGGKLPGFLGPVFLLSPLALLALRRSQGRRLLFAAAVFSIPVWFNPAVRFLIPAVSFVAMAAGQALANSPGVLPALAAFHALLSLPAVTPVYSASWAWRIREVPIRVALGGASEDRYIERFVPGYWLQAAVQENVPKSQKIFSFATRPEAYLNRWIVVGYESAEGVRIAEELGRGERSAVDRLGVHYLLVNDSDSQRSDIEKYLSLLRLSLIEQRDGTSLYRFD